MVERGSQGRDIRGEAHQHRLNAGEARTAILTYATGSYRSGAAADSAVTWHWMSVT